MCYGYVRIAAAVPDLKVADCKYNIGRIIYMINQAVKNNVQIIAFPELSVTGYSCGDLFKQSLLIDGAEKELIYLLDITKNSQIIIIVGMPIRHKNQLLNCGIVLQKGKIIAAIPKTYLPNYKDSYEKRWFSSSNIISNSYDYIDICGQNRIPISSNILIKHGNLCFAVEIGDDLSSPIPPSSNHCIQGANMIFNISAYSQTIERNSTIKQLIKGQSKRCIAAYIHTSAGMSESTTDSVYSGNIFIAENGNIVSSFEQIANEEKLIINEIDMELLNAQRQESTIFNDTSLNWSSNKEYKTIECNIKEVTFNHLYRIINPHPFIANKKDEDILYNKVFSTQVKGLAKRYSHTLSSTAIIGISGGLDSTLALLVTIKAFDMLNLPRKNIIGVTMPGFGTSKRTLNNSYKLMNSLNITAEEIDIKNLCLQHFKNISHDVNIHNTTYENVQARERTQILMNIANQRNGLVIGTGDLSELALGWTTYNADHMSMYAVNIGVPKTLVRNLVNWQSEKTHNNSIKEVLLDILDTPITPELLPLNKEEELTQKTEDIIGPYELHDFFIYYTLKYGFSPAKIAFLARLAFNNLYDLETIRKYLIFFYKRFFSQQFKRSCLPDGPQIDDLSLSPRTNWRMPSDAAVNMWLDDEII